MINDVIMYTLNKLKIIRDCIIEIKIKKVESIEKGVDEAVVVVRGCCDDV